MAVMRAARNPTGLSCVNCRPIGKTSATVPRPAAAVRLAPSRKVAAMEAALPSLAGSRYESMAEKALVTHKDMLARPKHAKLMADVNKVKTSQEKLARLRAAVGAFEGTSFKTQLETAIRRETDNIKRGRFAALNASLAKAKSPGQTIAKIEAALPFYKGSSFEKQLTGRLMREKSVLIVPGDHFGLDHHLRISFGLPPDYLRAGLDRIHQLIVELGG